MTFQGDPYRVLGLAAGASVNEIRSAYRRLAKRYHPDAAGERALPRFLAIQAAYEALVDGNGDLRDGATGPAAGPAARTGAWRADPARARASRDAWRARGRSGAPGTAGDPGAAAGDPDEEAGATAEGSAGGAGPAAGGRERQPQGGKAEHHVRRHRRTATPGSTTYDEAAESPLDPAWDGGTWYGASSGTYWTLNPREYADPRKHGPEYRRRAWRAAGQRVAPGEVSADDARPAPTADAGPRPGAPPGGAPDEPPPPPLGHIVWQPAPPSEGSLPTGPSLVTTLLLALVRALSRVGDGLLAAASGGTPGRVSVAVLAAAPAAPLAALAVAGLAGCPAGGCPLLVPVVAMVAWVVVALVVAAAPAAAALGSFAVLVAGAGSLVSGLVLAFAATGDLPGAIVRAAGSIGAVLYCLAMVLGGARLYAHREPDPPGP